ncbi:MFS transporter [Streptomyces sp. G44]|uniref:MFS transporter n=1 Tax=Streptomyces sp. G44 TaxID=2807632 RepID=UPI001EF8D763|nr:MFS transporter [Streptomyces sp. G44]
MGDAGTRRVTPLHKLVLGQSLIGIAYWALLIVIESKATFTLREDAAYMAAIAVAWGGPSVLLSHPVGRIIDAVGPRTVGIVASGAAVVTTLAMIVTDTAALLWAVTLASGVARAFAQPAADAMPSWLPGRVEHVTSSIWMGFATSLPFIAGPTTAAVCIALWGTVAAFGVIAAVSLVGGLVFVSLGATVRPAPEGAGSKIGARVLMASFAVAVALVLTLVTSLANGAFRPLEPLYVREVLDRPAATFATIEVIFGIGLLGATFFMLRWKHLLDHARFLPASVVLIAVGEAVYIGTDRVPVAFAGVFVWGVAVGLFGPACRIALLRGVASEHHGRAMALWRAIQATGSLVAPAVSGLIAAVVGIQAILLAVSALVGVSGAVVWSLVGLRTRRTPPPVAAKVPPAAPAGARGRMAAAEPSRNGS